MITNIKSWLSGYYKITEDDVEIFFANENITGFLIIWTIFEQQLFDGFATAKKVNDYSHPKSQEIFSRLKDEFNHFFGIYQESRRFNNLIHDKGQNKKEVARLRDILNSENEINENDKLFLILFVVYRYRNNIFHGNKKVQSWLQYEQEITRCVSVMKTLLEFGSKAENTGPN